MPVAPATVAVTADVVAPAWVVDPPPGALERRWQLRDQVVEPGQHELGHGDETVQCGGGPVGVGVLVAVAVAITVAVVVAVPVALAVGLGGEDRHAAPQAAGVDPDEGRPRGRGRGRGAGDVRRATHQHHAVELHPHARRHAHVDPAHDGPGGDVDHRAVELGVAEVQVDAAPEREGGDIAGHPPAAAGVGPAHDRDEPTPEPLTPQRSARRWCGRAERLGPVGGGRRRSSRRAERGKRAGFARLARTARSARSGEPVGHEGRRGRWRGRGNAGGQAVEHAGELGAGAGGVDLADELLELVQAEAARAGVAAQQVDDRGAVLVADPFVPPVDHDRKSRASP
jgi:hypothetical protein